MTTDRDEHSPPFYQSPRGASAAAVKLAELGAEASRLIKTAKAENTRRGYRSDWADFVSWCEKYYRASLPAAANTVAYYLADRSQDLKTSTLKRRLATIAEAHRAAGLESPTKN